MGVVVCRYGSLEFGERLTGQGCPVYVGGAVCLLIEGLAGQGCPVYVGGAVPVYCCGNLCLNSYLLGKSGFSLHISWPLVYTVAYCG